MNDKNSFSLRMKFRHKDLLTLLISLFILGLGGCKNPSGVGLEVPPGEEISGFFTDTVSVHGYTVRDDSLQDSIRPFSAISSIPCWEQRSLIWL